MIAVNLTNGRMASTPLGSGFFLQMWNQLWLICSCSVHKLIKQPALIPASNDSAVVVGFFNKIGSVLMETR